MAARHTCRSEGRGVKPEPITRPTTSPPLRAKLAVARRLTAAELPNPRQRMSLNAAPAASSELAHQAADAAEACKQVGGGRACDRAARRP